MLNLKRVKFKDVKFKEMLNLKHLFKFKEMLN